MHRSEHESDRLRRLRQGVPGGHDVQQLRVLGAVNYEALPLTPWGVCTHVESLRANQPTIAMGTLRRRKLGCKKYAAKTRGAGWWLRTVGIGEKK